MTKALIVRVIMALAIPVSAAAGAALLVYNPAAHAAFCEGN